MSYPTINETIAVYLSYVDWQKDYHSQSPLAKDLMKEVGLLLDVRMPSAYCGGYSQWVFHSMYDVMEEEMTFAYSIN